MEPFRPKDTLLGNDSDRYNTEYHGGRTPLPANARRYGRWNPSRYIPNTSSYMPTQRVVVPHGIRIGLRVLTLLLSLVIIGVLAHAIHVRESTKGERIVYPHGTTIAAWPHSLTMHPTLLLLAATVVAAIFNSVALATLAGFDKFRTTGRGNLLTSLSLFVGLATWIASVVYFKLWDTGKVRWWDLWSWACAHKQFEIKNGNHAIGFGTICTEMKLAYYAAVGVTVLEGLNLLAFWMNKFADLAERRKDKGSVMRPLRAGQGYEKVGHAAGMIGA